jgi:hypothetical protein
VFQKSNEFISGPLLNAKSNWQPFFLPARRNFFNQVQPPSNAHTKKCTLILPHIFIQPTTSRLYYSTTMPRVSSEREYAYQKAIEGLQSGKYETIYAAARVYGLERTTLSRRHNGGTKKCRTLRTTGTVAGTGKTTCRVDSTTRGYVDSKDTLGQTPLSRAAAGGNGAIRSNNSTPWFIQGFEVQPKKNRRKPPRVLKP